MRSTLGCPRCRGGDDFLDGLNFLVTSTCETTVSITVTTTVSTAVGTTGTRKGWDSQDQQEAGNDENYDQDSPFLRWHRVSPSIQDGKGVSTLVSLGKSLLLLVLSSAGQQHGFDIERCHSGCLARKSAHDPGNVRCSEAVPVLVKVCLSFQATRLIRRRQTRPGAKGCSSS